MNREYYFTSESVSEGHPDKVADQISDAILDACLVGDPESKVGCETLVTKNLVIVAGEFKTSSNIDVENIIRQTIKEIGYTNPKDGFSYDTCEIITKINTQSPDINRGIELSNGDIGAGDQGLMFGYATNETPELMPLTIMLAHKLVMKQSELRKSGTLPWLRPDAKSQVTVKYRGNNPVSVGKVILSTQHSDDINNNSLKEAVIEDIIKKVIPESLFSKDIVYLVNPTGRFVEGGPAADTGLTGRKIIVDTYGGSCPHGGGCFSGKDPTKVDRSAAYMARYVAKNIVAADLAERCTVQLSYAIGKTEPTSLLVNLHNSGKVSEEKLEKIIPEIFNLTPKGIIEMLNLRRPIYKQTSAYGHFGREIPDFSWEKANNKLNLTNNFKE